MSGRGSGDQYKEELFSKALRLYEKIMDGEAVLPSEYREYETAVAELKSNGWFDEWKNLI